MFGVELLAKLEIDLNDGDNEDNFNLFDTDDTDDGVVIFLIVDERDDDFLFKIGWIFTSSNDLKDVLVPLKLNVELDDLAFKLGGDIENIFELVACLTIGSGNIILRGLPLFLGSLGSLAGFFAGSLRTLGSLAGFFAGSLGSFIFFGLPTFLGPYCTNLLIFCSLWRKYSL